MNLSGLIKASLKELCSTVIMDKKIISLGIYEIYAEGVNEKLLLGLKDNIKYGDKLWT